jgi:protein TonB
MFDAVLGQEPTRRRVGTGAMLSVVFHAGVLTGALWLSARAVAPHVAAGNPFITLRLPGPHGGARAGGAAPAAQAKAALPKHAIAKHVIPSAPMVAPPLPVEAAPAATAPEPTMGAPVDADGTTGGAGKCIGPNCSTGEGDSDGAAGKPGGGGDSEVRFGPGMTAPVLLSSVPIAIPADAREARVSGTMILNCRLDLTGAVSDCRVIKPLPFMEQAVINALMQRHYAPVTFQGEPVTVRYIFNVKVTAP